MVLGSRHEGFPCVLLYRSADATDWRYDGVLYREEQIAARTMECPDFFPLDGAHVLVAGLLGSEDPATERRNLSYAWIGDYDGRRFSVRAHHEIDAGPDLYAIQTFLRDRRRYAMAWMDDWDRSYPTKRYGWAPDLAGPRVLARGGPRTGPNYSLLGSRDAQEDGWTS